MILLSLYLDVAKTSNSNMKFDGNNPEPSTSYAPYRIFNLGNSKSIELMKFINYLEEAMA